MSHKFNALQIIARLAADKVIDTSEEALLRTAISEAEKQEPVAWMWKDGTMTFDADRADGTWTPLYTIPPAAQPVQQEWVGLTNEEVESLWSEWNDAVCLDYKTWGRAIESRLKEKNTKKG